MSEQPQATVRLSVRYMVNLLRLSELADPSGIYDAENRRDFQEQLQRALKVPPAPEGDNETSD